MRKKVTHVDDDHTPKIAAETGQIFHEYTVIENAVLSEQVVG